MRSLEKSAEEYRALEQRTRLQTDCMEWRDYRKKLLTASIFGKVCKMRPTTGCSSTVKAILYKEDFYAKSVMWGRNNEDVARDVFCRNTSLEISTCGLCVNSKWPYLGVSSDGMASDGAILEIKCLYAARDMTVTEAVQTGAIKYLQLIDEAFEIKKNTIIIIKSKDSLTSVTK